MAVKPGELVAGREYTVTRPGGVDGLSPEGDNLIAAHGMVLVYVGSGAEGRHWFRFHGMRVVIGLTTYYLQFLDAKESTG